VLDGAGLIVARGRLVHVGGGNGAGKTTLLRVLAGLLDPDAGAVRVEGIDPLERRRDYQRRVSYVSAGNAGLYARLTVERQLALWARLAFVAPEERERRIGGILRAFGLDGLRGRRVDRLSMGQRQRLRLGLAFLPPARLLLLDEPHTSLDAEGDATLAAALRAHLAMGGAAVWCSPEPHRSLAPDQAFVVRAGRLVAA
jgi:ABC-type multidrug transport system ATPase subunit